MVNITDPALLRGFSVFMRARLGLPYPIPVPTEPAVCLVRRSGNRRILNEDEMVAALSKFVRVEVVQFDALSYREQVSRHTHTHTHTMDLWNKPVSNTLY